MGDLVTRVQAYITRHALIVRGETVVVAVSGGADSLVLLHVLCALRDSLGLRLHAATLDHGIRGESGAADVAFVRAVASAWAVPVTADAVDVPALAARAGRGVEAAARDARYAFLARVARSVGARAVATGHTRDDQAETVLLHLIRGSGLDGLRGMLPVTPLESQTPFNAEVAKSAEKDRGKTGGESEHNTLIVIRPLLDVSREEIDAYGSEHGLQPREDATNRDLTYLRNRLRHEIIPLLESFNPHLKATLARTAAILRADADLIAHQGSAALARVLIAARENAVILDRGAWNTLRRAEKRYVIRAAFRQVQPDRVELAFEHVEAAIMAADHGPTGAAATLPGGMMLRVERTTLSLAPADHAVIYPDAPALPPDFQGAPFSAGEAIRQPFGGWVFEAQPLPAEADLGAIHADPLAAALAISPGSRLVLRTRAPRDRFRPRGMGGRSQKLSDTFNAMRVPAAGRDTVPLLVVDNEIGWFVAPTPAGTRGRVAEACAITESHPKNVIVMVRWQRADLYQP